MSIEEIIELTIYRVQDRAVFTPKDMALAILEELDNYGYKVEVKYK